MFRIIFDPSWGSIELYLTEIRTGSLKFSGAWSVFGSVILNQWCVCVWYNGLVTTGSPSYWTHTPLVQNYAAKHRPSTRQTSVNHYE